ncbi:hypothetical protein VDBG_09378 [Verticillium alfalfae VaMs.102]|uniref:Uncharacterized protein n=1 Tax=Verticillium alfalfae (strain VaMs.102 / ATCC MYA-4576 / FGSC 10136) TaxID=526221 RepID=C9SX78_VERA1|nr:hypothetical protein VDBG_09378 [Verticillium alfalfae VaMs.102]EEY23268.1 hypothetical protein VDBG_09378 [Verticillium alfalfae VaMs.102]
MFDFDAGIESPHSSHDIVRSVSPSSLEGLSKPGSPPVLDLSDLATPDTDDEEESYMRFAPHHFGLPSTLRDFMMDSKRSKPSQASDSPSSPLDAPRGRSRGSRPVGRGRQPSFATRRRSQQVWREPSPDVWSIEEETEEAMSELGSTMVADIEAGEVLASAMKKDRTRPVDIQAAKPTKKVRGVQVKGAFAYTTSMVPGGRMDASRLVYHHLVSRTARCAGMQYTRRWHASQSDPGNHNHSYHTTSCCVSFCDSAMARLPPRANSLVAYGEDADRLPNVTPSVACQAEALTLLPCCPSIGITQSSPPGRGWLSETRQSFRKVEMPWPLWPFCTPRGSAGSVNSHLMASRSGITPAGPDVWEFQGCGLA